MGPSPCYSQSEVAYPYQVSNLWLQGCFWPKYHVWLFLITMVTIFSIFLSCFKLSQNLSSCQVSEKFAHRFDQNDGTNIETAKQAGPGRPTNIWLILLSLVLGDHTPLVVAFQKKRKKKEKNANKTIVQWWHIFIKQEIMDSNPKLGCYIFLYSFLILCLSLILQSFPP